MLKELIDSISGDREADFKIKKSLQGLYEISCHAAPEDASVDDEDELRAMITDLVETNEMYLVRMKDLEVEMNSLRAIITEMDEADSELRAEITELSDEVEDSDLPIEGDNDAETNNKDVEQTE